MKPDPSEAPPSEDPRAASSAPFEKPTRRTFAEAAVLLGRSMVGGNRARSSGRRGSSETSAASSAQRLREVLDRDRALAVARQIAAQELRGEAEAGAARLAHGERHHPDDSEQARLCTQCGKREHAATSEAVVAGEASAALAVSASHATQAGRDKPPAGARPPLRVPPLPPARKGPVVEFAVAVEDDDEDGEPSVHNEPTKVGPPPPEPADGAAAALAAAAATAFGSLPSRK